MTTYAVTGSTGHLGRLVVQELLARGVPCHGRRRPCANAGEGEPNSACRCGLSTTPTRRPFPRRSPASTSCSSSPGTRGREAGSRSTPPSSRPPNGRRGAARGLHEHRERRHSANPLTPEHKATEDVLRASGLPFTILRDNWYLENYTAQLPQYLGRARSPRDRRRRPHRRRDPRGHGGRDHAPLRWSGHQPRHGGGRDSPGRRSARRAADRHTRTPRSPSAASRPRS